MKRFVGRAEELALLEVTSERKVANLVVLRGRRRIGKSRLAEKFGEQYPKTYILTGLAPNAETTAQQEREDFAAQLARTAGIRGVAANDWGDLFWHLAQATQKGRVLIVLDEINWMGSKDPTFLSKLKSAWDLYFKNNTQLMMVLSGSMSAWIEKNILSHTGFMGRISLDLTLDELPLAVCDQFWGAQAKHVSAYEKFKILSIMGGVPRYLEEINPKLTAEENIQQLAFRREGLLFNEFERIFTDLFSKRSAIYQKIVEKLAYGIADFNQLADALEYQKSGVLSGYLDDLIETGYVKRDYTWEIKTGKQASLSHYRLCDNYLRFYLRYILPNRSQIEKGRLSRLPAWDAILGLQFENLVINNFHLLEKLLEIKSDDIIYANPFFQRKTREQQGCQIDYMIQTKFNVLYVCEMKFSKEKISNKIIQEVEEKIARIKLPRNVSYRSVLIHVNGVTDAVIESDFFAKIIDFSDFLSG